MKSYHDVYMGAEHDQCGARTSSRFQLGKLAAVRVSKAKLWLHVNIIGSKQIRKPSENTIESLHEVSFKPECLHHVNVRSLANYIM